MGVPKIASKSRVLSRASEQKAAPSTLSTPSEKVKKQKRKAEVAVDADVSEDEKELEWDKKRSKKDIVEKKAKKKETTVLYAELINPGRERKAEEIIDELLEQLRSRSSTLPEYVGSKIGSRVVQACLKWGTRKQRQELLVSLKDDLPKMATDRYGHVVVMKLLTYAMKTAKDRKPTEQEKKAQAQNLKDFLEPFRGKHLHAAFFHKHGCKVINGIYFSEVVGQKDKRRLLHDVAVPQAVSLLRPELPGSVPLRQIMEAKDLTAEQRKSISVHLKEAADKAVDKELLGCDVTHFIFQAFCEHASEDQLKDLCEKSMPGAPYLLSSKPGAEALIRILGVANAKQRKEFCRELKGKFGPLASNAVDYVVMMRLAATVDDTVLLSKTMLAEWIADIENLCFDKYGHKALAWILRPADPRFFSPYEIKFATLPAPTSLKPQETRRQELLKVLRPPLRKALMQAPLKAAADDHGKETLLAFLTAEWDADLIEALLKAGETEREEKDLGLLGNNGTATTTMLALLKMEPAEAKAPLAMPLWKRCLEPQLIAAVTSRCSFLLLALLKQTGPARDVPLAALRKRRKEVLTAVNAAEKEGVVVKGARKLLEELDKGTA